MLTRVSGSRFPAREASGGTSAGQSGRHGSEGAEMKDFHDADRLLPFR
jgi:hypothetical protein